MAKSKGVTGWHAMRKEQLIAALVRLARKKAKSSTASPSRVAAKNGQRRDTPQPATTSPKILEKIREQHRKDELFRDLSLPAVSDKRRRPLTKDRIVLLVRDPYWLHIYWEITKATIRRAQVALADRWHEARPTLRILNICDDGAENAVDVVYRDVPIRGGVNNWYVDVSDPPGSFRAVLGYQLGEGRFHVVAKSNAVSTPLPASAGAFDAHWSEIANDFERIYSLSGGASDKPDGDLRDVFEEKLRRPMAAPVFARFGAGINAQHDGFHFEVDAELVIFGSTDPKANVTLSGEPVKLRPDGTFAVSMSLPDRRQVIPIVAHSRDGNRQCTTVMAIERNTKVMEPLHAEVEEI
jgi:hypothetical protein